MLIVFLIIIIILTILGGICIFIFPDHKDSIQSIMSMLQGIGTIGSLGFLIIDYVKRHNPRPMIVPLTTGSPIEENTKIISLINAGDTIAYDVTILFSKTKFFNSSESLEDFASFITLNRNDMNVNINTSSFTKKGSTKYRSEDLTKYITNDSESIDGKDKLLYLKISYSSKPGLNKNEYSECYKTCIKENLDKYYIESFIIC